MAQKKRDINENTRKPLEVSFYPEKAVVKEMKKLPERERDRFLNNLYLKAANEDLTCDSSPLSSLGHGVYELCINGSPAWRCIYYTGLSGKLVVMHVCEKTTNGQDRQIKNVVGKRLKALGCEPKAA
ncbi:type II toxin-antitoxin system RelE/ParE family toxin [Pseudomonas syringae]|uniref:type II toxin-antitoxin system RelE/ParE family toxin n=1 Tax=Pseudomonas syringae TaxID=317 RepID=UPI00178431F7|nr:type II toxin-antitoxin system RelE/ParE family toxin [Pseudomonas syringae]